jgi:hypothetical protein
MWMQAAPGRSTSENIWSTCVDKLKHRLIARNPRRDNGTTFLLDQGLPVISLAIAAAILTRSHISDIIQSVQLASTNY